MPQVHFIPLSNQPEPIVCSLSDARLKPDEVVILTTSDDEHQFYAQCLKSLCQSLGIRYNALQLDKLWDADHLRERLESEVANYTVAGYTLCLNCSAELRPVSIIAHEVFFYKDLPVFYLDRDWVRWLHRPNGEQDFNLDDKIKIPAYLGAHGLKVENLDRSPIPKGRRELAKLWFESAATVRKAMVKLNGYALAAQASLQCSIHDIDLQGHSDFTRLLDQLVNSGLAHLEGKSLQFVDESARAFANGTWLEEHVYSALLQLRSDLPKIQDLARSVELNWLESRRSKQVENELDVVVLYDNRLVVIECKTARMDRGVPQHVVYKLGALVKHLGGRQTTGVVVSFHRIASIHQERAKLFDVDICDASRLSKLESGLRHHLEHGV
jgi:hypothetical protein